MVLVVILVAALVYFLTSWRIKYRNNLLMQVLLKKHEREIAAARLDAVKQSKNVLRGQLSEEMIPLFPNFPYKLEDCRFLGSPIDYLILDGMSEFRDVDSNKEVTVILADIKYGTAARTKVQNAIRKAIKEGRIKFETIKLDNDNHITIK